jgi:ribosomal protein S6 kinase alpha-5
VFEGELYIEISSHFATEKVLIDGTNGFILSLQESPFFENYELDLKESILGDGSSSLCRKCTNRQTREEFAVKIVSRKIDCTEEINLLRTCQGHPNIVSLHEVYYDEVSLYSLGFTLNGEI